MRRNLNQVFRTSGLEAGMPVTRNNDGPYTAAQLQADPSLVPGAILSSDNRIELGNELREISDAQHIGRVSILGGTLDPNT